MLWIHLSLYTLPSLTLTLFLLSLHLLHHHRPQAHNQSTTHRHTLNELHAPLKTLEFYNGMLAVFPPLVMPFFPTISMTFFSSKKPIFRQPRTFKSLDILLFIWIGHSPDRALSPPEIITPVVVSSLLSTLTWPSLLFLSPLFLPSTPTQTTSVLKFFFSNHSPLQFLNLHSPPIRSTPFDSRTRTFSSHILPNSLDTFFLEDCNAHHPTWDSFISPDPPGNDLFCCFTSFGQEILNDPTSPTLLHHSTGSRLSPNISLAPASLAPHCEWRTLPGLGSDHLPIEIVLPFSPLRRPNTRLPSCDVDVVNLHQAARSFSLFLVEAAKASILFGCLGRSPKAWWSQEAESAVRERRRAHSEAHPTSGPFLLRTCSASPPRLLQPQCPGNKKRALLIKEETLLEIILFFGHTITPIPT